MSPFAGRRRVYLMRHGRVDYFSDEVLRAQDHRVARLTAEGRAQAAAAGEALKEAGIDFAVHSGLPRTQETLEIAISAFDAPVDPQAEPDFEEIKGGTLRFPSREEAAAAIREQFSQIDRPGAAMFGGEAFSAAQARAVAALTRIVLSPGWDACLIVAHEGINRLILSWAAGAGQTAAPAFEQDVACVNVIDFDVETDGENRPFIARRILKLVNATPYNWLKHGMSRTSLEAIFAVD